MDDWRLRGQEEYLKGLTFYKVRFPDFWQKAYDEKNAFYQMISTEGHRFVEQMQRGEEYLEGEKIQHFWHEHCEFCWEKATTDKECVFYCTKDMHYWVCPDCFNNFKNSFGWVEKDSTELFDEKIVMTRKVLTLEQFRDDRARELATKHFLTGLTDMFTHVFTGMMDKGLLRKDDPQMLAFSYTTPISALIHLCDREPEKTEDATEQIEAFSRHFIATYGVK